MGGCGHVTEHSPSSKHLREYLWEEWCLNLPVDSQRFEKLTLRYIRSIKAVLVFSRSRPTWAFFCLCNVIVCWYIISEKYNYCYIYLLRGVVLGFQKLQCLLLFHCFTLSQKRDPTTLTPWDLLIHVLQTAWHKTHIKEHACLQYDINVSFIKGLVFSC